MKRNPWQYSCAILLAGLSSKAFAHERWIKHDLRYPVNEAIFHDFSVDTASIVGRALLILVLVTVIWKFRSPLQNKIGSFCARFFPNSKLPATLLKFVFDETIYSSFTFETIIPYVQRFALRAPALVLMYAAAGNFLLMPTFPLDPSTDSFLKYMQVVLAIMILCEFMLPVVGWILVATLVYIACQFGIVCIDAFPILGLAFIYITMPMFVKRTVLFIRANQLKVLKILLGLSFASLGIMKLVDYSPVIGALDNHPQLGEDLVIRLFSIGTDDTYRREWWAFGFGVSEVLTGLIIALGMFKRVICLVTALVFLKLMMVNIGWEEFPHIYPISNFILVVFSRIYSPSSENTPFNRRRSDQYNLQNAKTVFQKIAALYFLFIDKIN